MGTGNAHSPVDTTSEFIWAASINKPNKWSRWHCPSCKLWVNEEVRKECQHCRSEKVKCPLCLRWTSEELSRVDGDLMCSGCRDLSTGTTQAIIHKEGDFEKKWLCPGCEIWQDFPKTSLCHYCLEERDRCQECGGTRYHIGDCSALSKNKAPKLGSEWPCIVCGGATAHNPIAGELLCEKVKAKEEFPCAECKGTWRHWSDCSKYASLPVDSEKVRLCDLDLAERLASAMERTMAQMNHNKILGFGK